MKTALLMAVVALIFWITTCSCVFNPVSSSALPGPHGVISPSKNLDPIILEMWAIAQERLASDLPNITGDPYLIKPQDFRWELMDGLFTCSPTEGTAGCFSYRDRRIRVWLKRVGAVIHESKHAILFGLGDVRWHCYEHPDEQPCEL